MHRLRLNASGGISRIFLMDEIPDGDGSDKKFNGIKVFMILKGSGHQLIGMGRKAPKEGEILFVQSTGNDHQ